MRPLILALFVFVPSAFGQFDRYELGRRIHDFELAWEEKADDQDAKKRAAPLVNQAVQNFFKLNIPNAAQSLDAARHALASSESPSPAIRWADSLQVVPEARVVDAASDDVSVTIKPFYKVDAAPKGAIARAKLGAGKPVEIQLNELPATIKVPIKSVAGTPSADFPLVVQISVDGKTLSRKVTRISRIENFAERLAAVKKLAANVPSPPKTIEQATFLLLVKLLDDAAHKRSLETDYPMSRLMFGAERLSKIAEPYYIPKRAGEFWLSIPTGKRTTVVRIRIPPKLEEKKSVPVLIALHGAGGSENLYFEGYGAGIIPRLAADRGWLVVAPRVEGLLGAGPAPNVPAILDELAKRYPIDSKRVYLIGHSMGAAHALELAQKSPERYAAVALLGGSGKLLKPESLKPIRFFVGCGKLDATLQRARALHRDLEKAGVPCALHEYDNIEHLLIVRAAAADVFEFFDAK
jgi:predicted esterase